MIRAALIVLIGVAATTVVGQFLAAQELAAAMVGAVLVELLASRVKVASTRAEDATPIRAKRAAIGAAIGLGAVIVAIGLATAIGWSHLQVGAPSIVAIGLALVRSVALAARDEVAFRLLPIELFGRLGARPLGVLLAIGLGAVVLDPVRSPVAALGALALGALATTLYARSGDIVTSIGANGAVRFATGTLLTSVVEARLTRGTLVPLERASGPVTALVALSLVAAAALAWAKKARAASA